MQPAEKLNTENSAMAAGGNDWLEIGLIDEIPRLGARVVQNGEERIAVFRNAEDEVFALLDKCPHKGGPLSQGIVFDRTVACPLHNWCIHLDSGLAKAPDEGSTIQYPVRVEDGQVFLCLTPTPMP